MRNLKTSKDKVSKPVETHFSHRLRCPPPNSLHNDLLMTYLATYCNESKTSILYSCLIECV